MDTETLILRGPELRYEPVNGGLGVEIYHSLQLHKDKTARFVIETGESCTYGDLLRSSTKLALHLRSKGLKKEDTICLCSHNTIQSSTPFFAAKFIDVNYASIEPTMPDEDLIYLFQYIKPKVILIAENLEDKIQKCLEEANIQSDIIILGNSQTHTSLATILLKTEDEEFSPMIIENLEETAIIFFSSGTTGKPKGICINHRSLLSKIVDVAQYLMDEGSINMSNFSMSFGADSYSNTLSYSPMYWISGVALVLTTTFHGSIISLGSTFNVETFCKALKKFKPTACFTPPGDVVDIYMEWKENPHKFDDNVMRLFMTGGGPVRPYHLDYLRQIFPKAATIQMYGMTETSGLITTFNLNNPRSLELQLKYPESCGQIVSSISVKIADVETDQPCGYNQQGELRIKTRQLMNGYYQMDTTSCFDDDGWFKTGDLAYINEDDCLVIVDRIKDILLYTLYNIRPSVIEDILAQHPSVHECFVIGIPHPKDNEHPMGVVKLKDDGNQNVQMQEIVDFVNERVPSDRYEIRAGLKIVDQMIKTPTGKIKKSAMKKLILEGKL